MNKKFREIRYEEKKNKILESAARIFSVKGYEKATMEDVANELKMTKGSLYYYIRSKEDMLFQCHIRALRIGINGLKEILNSKCSPKEKLYKSIIKHVELITKEFVIGSLRQQELLLPKKMFEKVVNERDKFEKIFLKIYGNAVKERHLSQDYLKISAYAILGAINWIARWYSPKGKLSPNEIGKIMADFLTKNLNK